jgi:hypothetical protein
MAYLRYYDDRFGDMYEVYYSSADGEFEGAARHVGGEVGKETIYYDLLSEVPPYHRNRIEHKIWQRLHPPSKSQESSRNDE